MRHNLFLVVKEALNNIVKHARATEVCLRLSVKDKTLSLVIKDNGCGFDLAHSALHTPHSPLGNGLVNMRERMTQLGGQLTVESVPGQGTRIAISAPL
jgi:signal transduction histidine kinase